MRLRPAALGVGGGNQWSFAVAQTIGRRSEQQDAYGRSSIRLADGEVAPLVLVADGMGGEAGGRLAAETAVRAFLGACQDGVASDIALRLRDALLAANAAVGAAAAESRDLSGMGCTLLALVLGRGRATWVSVGDSLLLRQRGARLERLNADHSMAPALDEAARAGEMTAEDAAAHPRRHMLVSALTGRTIALIDEQNVALVRGDRFILASDGLLTLAGEEISAAARQGGRPSPQALAVALLAAVEAKAELDQDNCTIAVAGAVHTFSQMSRGTGIALLIIGATLLAVPGAIFVGRHVEGISATRSTTVRPVNVRSPSFSHESAREESSGTRSREDVLARKAVHTRQAPAGPSAGGGGSAATGVQGDESHSRKAVSHRATQHGPNQFKESIPPAPGHMRS